MKKENRFIGLAYLWLLLGGLYLPGALGQDSPEFEKSFTFVRVEPGEFIMGSPLQEKGRFDDEIPHPVKITKPFEIGKTEVTQGLWKRVMGRLPKDTLVKDDNLPVTYVSWNDVQAFVKRLNNVRKGDGYLYRLPTEAEWEYAARGGHKASPSERQQAYHFGSSDIEANEYSWNWSNAKMGVKPVATRKPNQLGLYDIYGNVWEWTEDKYIADVSKLRPHPAFGHPVNTTHGKDRVLRGGCTSRNTRLMRSAYRGFLPADSPFGNLGVRLVRVEVGK